jgi:RNA methyltransferase, TrmH family
MTKRITSRDNAQFKQLVKLATSSRERKAVGATLLDGPHLVSAYHASGRVAETLVVADDALNNPEIRGLFESAAANQRLVVSDRLFGDIAQVATPTGITAVIATPDNPPLPDSLQTCLLLDELQDWGNVGSILRSAAAAGIRQVFLSPGSVFAWSPKTLRAGQGAHFFLEIHEGVDLVAIARRHPGAVIATEARAATTVYAADLRGPTAWAFGNEGAGLSEALADAATLRVRIPMPGAAESLNVAAAAAICLFEQVRQRGA